MLHCSTLGGLASADPIEVRSCASSALSQWDKLDASEHLEQHAMSRRFLDPLWAGLDGDSDISDPPLRPLMERLSTGR